MSDVLQSFSSFGPLGRTKAIKTATGTVIISRDSTHFLDAILPDHIWFKNCITHGKRYGDGKLSQLILMSKTLKVFNSHLSEFVRKLRIPLSIIISAYWESYVLIVNGMLSSHCWELAYDDISYYTSVWMSILTPASNENIASGIVKIMLKWLTSDSSRNTIITENFDHVLNHFNFFVQAHIGGGVLDQSYILSNDALLIEGRCKNNFTFVNESPISSNQLNSNIYLRFIIIYAFSSYINQSNPSGGSSSMQLATVLQVGSFADLVSQYQTSVRSFAEFLQFLKMKYNVQVIFTTTEVSGSLLHEIAAEGITIVDRVPPVQLTYLSEKVSVRVWESELDIIQSEARTAAGANESPSRSAPVGQLSYLHIVYLRPKTYDPAVCLRGLQPPHTSRDTFPSDSARSNCPVPQLVLRVESEAIGRLYTNMIHRCLTAIAATKSHGRPPSAGLDSGRLLVPGGGAAEMAWSLLWERVADRIGQPALAASASEARGAESASTALESVANQLSERVLARLDKTISGESNQVSAKVNIIWLCRLLASAYGEIPLTLLRNSRCIASGASELSAQLNASLNREWLAWRESCRAEAGRIGLNLKTINRTGRLSYTRPSYSDSFEAGVASSGITFLAGFSSLLDTLTLFVRVGGDSGVVYIRSKASRVEKTKKSVHRIKYDSDSDCGCEGGEDS